MAQQLVGINASVKADVNSSNELKVSPTKVLQESGYAAIAGLASDLGGSAGKLIRSTDVSMARRLRVGVDNPQWEDTFNHTQLNLGKYKYFSSTAVAALSGNALVLNSGNSVAAAAATLVTTWKTFPVLGRAGAVVSFAFSLATLPVAGNVNDAGVGVNNTTAPYTPGDGVYLRVSTSGLLQLVININGGESAVSSSLVIVASQVYEARIEITPFRVELYINELLEAVSSRPLLSQVTINPQVPFFVRYHNTTVVASAQQFRISRISITSLDETLNRSYAQIKAEQQQHVVNAQDGLVPGQASSYVVNQAPSSFTPSSASAGYTTPGGQFTFLSANGSETDGCVFAFGPSALTTAGGVPGKNLIVLGVRIETYVFGAAMGAGITLLQWAIGIGASSLNQATADAINGVRGVRRMPLGCQSFASLSSVGTLATPIDVKFAAPYIVEPGALCQIIFKQPVGTLQASQAFRGMVMVDAYYQ